MKTSKGKTILIMGLALFATFFGAGNLIFPPYLGRETGSSWFLGFFGFFIMDVGLGVLAILATVFNRQGNIQGVVGKIGKIPGEIMAAIIIICIGPGLCIPRTAATTFEMGVSTLFPVINPWIFGAAFFIIVLLLTIRPTKVVDIVGNYLTPILLAVMLALIVLGIISPIGPITAASKVVPLKEGMLSGYQTMDGIGALLLTGIFTTAAYHKGFTEKQEVSRMVGMAGIIAGGLLMLVYCGLTYLGATSSGGGFEDLNQAELLLAIAYALTGKSGMVLLAVIVFLACLTTAVGLTSVAADYFHNIFDKKIKYSHLVIGICVFSFVVSNFGLTKIINISAPILGLLYPPILVLVLLTFFDDVFKNDNIARFGAYFAFLTSALELAGKYGVPVDFVNHIPFATYGCAWIVPSLVGCALGACLKKKAIES
ncbi:branched-chain amino acid transport system II carrier protein [Anaerotignum sp.]|uniref:branched-chain amino acid transport system II carrier protein n=1 Tax=Anaerotignum sp. TaxID=2039241 RepID=UPI002898F733|nr:branched-chain amino acid transport system II carrier protein [Anaerotignum sp.]